MADGSGGRVRSESSADCRSFVEKKETHKLDVGVWQKSVVQKHEEKLDREDRPLKGGKNENPSTMLERKKGRKMQRCLLDFLLETACGSGKKEVVESKNQLMKYFQIRLYCRGGALYASLGALPIPAILQEYKVAQAKYMPMHMDMAVERSGPP
jgi:hypothetical protein